MERTLAVLFCAFAAACAAAAEYPAKPVRIITPFPPGGSVDLVARLIGADLSKPLGQQVVIDNRTGASGIIGTELAKNAAPDGYALLVNTLPFVTNQFAYEKVPYDPINDFASISLLASVASVLVCHPALPVNSMKDLIALARSKPNEITYGTAGAATNPHIAGELLNNLAKIKLLAVHYKGGGPAQIATLSGETQLYFVNAIPEALPHIQAKKLRALGITAAKRNPTAPDIPTMAEAGLPGYEVLLWFGLYAPAGTPQAVVQRLHQAALRGLSKPEVKEKVAVGGMDASPSASPEAFDAEIRAEAPVLTRIIRESGAKIE